MSCVLRELILLVLALEYSKSWDVAGVKAAFPFDYFRRRE
jgi:hypothetical protein